MPTGKPGLPRSAWIRAAMFRSLAMPIAGEIEKATLRWPFDFAKSARSARAVGALVGHAVGALGARGVEVLAARGIDLLVTGAVDAFVDGIALGCYRLALIGPGLGSSRAKGRLP